jgi:hypothetical protein
MALGDIILLRDFRTSLADVNGEGILDTEDGIGGFVGVIAEVEGTGFCQKSLRNKTETVRKGTYVIKWS